MTNAASQCRWPSLPLEVINLLDGHRILAHEEHQAQAVGLIVIDVGYDLFMTMVLYPSFAWDEPAYHLEGDLEGRTFAEILVDVLATEVIEPWGGGKWHLEIFRSSVAEPEDWNGEMWGRPGLIARAGGPIIRG